MDLTSPAFEDGETIPTRHTCDGADVSPALHWTDPPAGTQAFALIVHDPDAPRGDWVHWVCFDIHPEVRHLPEGADQRAASPPDRPVQGRNDFGGQGYGGPCPPPGQAHRYFFRLAALDQPLGLPAGASRAEVEAAMDGHVLRRAALMGRYTRADDDRP